MSTRAVTEPPSPTAPSRSVDGPGHGRQASDATLFMRWPRRRPGGRSTGPCHSGEGVTRNQAPVGVRITGPPAGPGSVDSSLMEELASERPLDQKVLQCLNPVDRLLWRRVISRQVAAGPDSFLCKTSERYGACYAAQALVARMWLLQASFCLVFMLFALVISRGQTDVESVVFLILGLSACLIGLIHALAGMRQRDTERSRTADAASSDSDRPVGWALKDDRHRHD